MMRPAITDTISKTLNTKSPFISLNIAIYRISGLNNVAGVIAILTAFIQTSMDAYMCACHVTRMSVTVTRVELSIGFLDLFRFESYEHSFPRHSHDRFTIGSFGKGNGSIRMRGTSSLAPEGCVLAIAPDAPHSADPLRGNGWTYRSLYPSQDLMGVALESDSYIGDFAVPVIDDRKLGVQINDIHLTLETAGATLGAEEKLLEVLRRVVDQYGGGAPTRIPAVAPRAVSLARSYLSDNYARAIKLNELAVQCAMSPFHLIRSFRNVTGMTPHAYLTQVRCNHARDMLLAGEGISAIAFRCGFSDQSHLTRTFKKIYGVTPGAYASAPSRAMS
ncbi:MAG TPA: AraC family transcriptional regulator [Gemmatimonadaceae bacterium]